MLKNALVVFLLVIGSSSAGEVEDRCEKTFSEFLDHTRKLDFFFCLLSRICG
jgi:hypothetical protein